MHRCSHRIQIGAALFLLGIVVMVVPAMAALAGTSWPKFQYDLNNTGQSPYAGSPVNTIQWTYQTGGAIYGSPAIGSDGTIYIGNYGDNKLYALNPDGTLHWTYQTGGAIYGSPAIGSDGTIYIGDYGDNKLYALNPDGTLHWTYTAMGGIIGSPSLGSDGTIYFGDAGTDKKLYALNPDGTLHWTYQTGGAIYGSPAIGSDGTIYIGDYGDKRVYALNPDGTLKWSYQTNGAIYGAPALGSEGTIYAGTTDRNVYALNPDGSLLWKYPTGGEIRGSPAIGSDGTIYIGDYGDNKLYALNPDGTLKWTYLTSGAIYGSPTIGADGTIYIGDYGDYKVYAVNHDGSLEWTYLTGGKIYFSSPTIGPDGSLYVGSVDSRIYAFAGTVNFTADLTRGPTPLAVRFRGASTLRDPAWSWDFGDGSTSTEQNPSHTYTRPGNYTVNLTITCADSINYLYKTGCVQAYSPPTAGFLAAVTSGQYPLVVSFADVSNGTPTSWSWDFGDGSTSTGQNPSHTYSAAGTYTVSLTVTNPAGTDTYRRTGYIVISAPPLPEASFTVSRNIGIVPLTVQFTDTSTGWPTSWYWDFGDGNTSIRENPTYTYTQPGNYTVTLTAKNKGGNSSMTLATPIAVRANRVPPGPDFSVNVSSGPIPLAVQFTDLSTGPGITGWGWDFNNDGIIDSTDQDPVCVYKLPGNYTVNLTVSNAFGIKTVSRNEFITAGVLAPVVSFTANNVSGDPPLIVQFTDLSTGPDITGWGWDFNNDGIIDSTDQDPVCVYKLPGNYTVDLTVTNISGSNTTSRAGFITVGSRAPVVSFTANNVSGTPPLVVQFTDLSTGPDITGWGWDFNNDGITDSTDQDPSCVYKRPGNYTVNLTATNAYGSNTTSAADFVTVTNGVTVDFTSNQTEGTAPLAVRFTDLSTGPDITGWSWDFNNDGITDSTDQNPSCVYNLPGNYTVNLTVTNAFGPGSHSKEGFVTARTLAPVAGFSTNSSTGIAPVAIQFSDTSSGSDITGWSWDFNNDGIIDSTDKNPQCVYTLAGNYTVNLTVTNAYGSNTTLKAGSVTVSSGVPTARFAVNKTSGYAPLTIQFKDLSTGSDITGWSWDFNNDGIIDSTEQNPFCVFNLPGTYTINFTLTNAYGSNTIVRKGFITVT